MLQWTSHHGDFHSLQCFFRAQVPTSSTKSVYLPFRHTSIGPIRSSPPSCTQQTTHKNLLLLISPDPLEPSIGLSPFCPFQKPRVQSIFAMDKWRRRRVAPDAQMFAHTLFFFHSRSDRCRWQHEVSVDSIADVCRVDRCPDNYHANR